MALNAPVFQRVRSFAVGTQIDLFQLDMTACGGGLFYATNNVMPERQAISFGGQTYTYIPVAMDAITIDTNTSPSQPRLHLATAGGPVTSMVQNYKDLRGTIVTSFHTFAEYLDKMDDGNGNLVANPNADGTAMLGKEVYVIDQKEAHDSATATFLCVSPIDVDGCMLPRRIVRKRWCDAMYRTYDSTVVGNFVYYNQVDGGCPYNGTNYFDEYDQPTTIDKDKCSKRMSGCMKRFGYTNTAGNLVTNVALPAQICPGVRAAQEA